MAVRTVYVSKLGRDYKISPHFKLRELQSKDGADKVLVSDELVAKLEELRAYLGGDGVATVGINSGYRTEAYNRSIGGASGSRHTKGDAADVVCKQNGKRISGKLVCALCQTLGFKGVALNKGTGYSVHLDMRPSGTYRGDERNGYGNNVGGDFYKYFSISKAQIEALRVRQEVEKPPKKEEENEMTKEEVKSIVYEAIAELMSKKAVEPPSGWSEEAREWAKGSDIVKGTNIGDEWKSPVDREQLVEIVYRLMQKIDPIK